MRIGLQIDRLWKQKEKVKLAQDEVKKMEDKLAKVTAKFVEYEAEIFTEFGDTALEGAIGSLAKVKIIKTQLPTVKDWNKVYKFIHRTKSFDLLQKRMSSVAWRARFEDKKLVPGTECFTKKTLSLTKK